MHGAHDSTPLMACMAWVKRNSSTRFCRCRTTVPGSPGDPAKINTDPGGQGVHDSTAQRLPDSTAPSWPLAPSDPRAAQVVFKEGWPRLDCVGAGGMPVGTLVQSHSCIMHLPPEEPRHHGLERCAAPEPGDMSPRAFGPCHPVAWPPPPHCARPGGGTAASGGAASSSPAGLRHHTGTKASPCKTGI